MPTTTPDGYIIDENGIVIGYADQQPQRGVIIPKPEPVKEPPSGYRWSANGSLEAIPGGPASDKAGAAKPNLPAGYMWVDPTNPTKGAIRIPGTEAAEGQGGEARMQRDQRLANLRALQNQLDRVRELYQQGPGATKGLTGFLDYLPTQANRQFEAAAAGLGDIGNAAFKVPGMGAQSDADAARFVAANQPLASDFDAQIEEKLRTIQQRLDEANAQLNPQTSPAARGTGAATAAGPTISGGGKTKVQVPPEMEQALAAYVEANRGKLTPEAYKRFVDGQAMAYGVQAQMTPEGAIQQVDAFNKGAAYGGVDAGERDKTTREDLQSSFLSSAPGAFVAQGANMGGLGIPQAIAGNDAFNAISDASPVASTLGQIGGAITGTGAIGAVGRKTVGSLLPSLMGGGARGAFGRNVATDAAYGGIFGGVTEGDPLTGAGAATLGSVAGQGVGSVVGRGLTGVTSPTARRLTDAGIPLTLGQIMRSRAIDNKGRSFIAGIEDVMANTGALNSVVNARRADGMEAGRLAAFNTVAAPTGRQVTDPGLGGLDQLGQIKNAAYDDAIGGVSLPVDPRFVQQVNSADSLGRAVDASRGRGDFGFIMDREVAPILSNPNTISGKQYQDVNRLLQGRSTAYAKASGGAAPDPSAMGVARSLEGVGNAFTGLVARQAPDVLPKLKIANSVNRGLNVLDDASSRAINEGGEWTPAQLGMAIKANDKKFGGRGISTAKNSPLFSLQQDMQAVLPNKVPPTGVNAAPALALGGAIVGGGGVATDNEYLKALGLAALLATPYTKAGQKVTEIALVKRPAALKVAGKKIRKRKGLFGSAAVPLAIDSATVD